MQISREVFEDKNINLLKKKPKKKCMNFKNWSNTDDSLLKRLFNNYGNKWKIIAKYFPSRTPYQLSYRMKILSEDKNNKAKDIDNQEELKFNTRSFENSEVNEQNYSSENGNSSHKFTIEKSFFENLNFFKKTIQFINAEENYEDLELSEEENSEFSDDFHKNKFILKLENLIKDISYLSTEYCDLDKNQHFETLLETAVRAYYCLTKNKKERF